MRKRDLWELKCQFSTACRESTTRSLIFQVQTFVKKITKIKTGVFTSLLASVADTSISISFDDSNSSENDEDDSDYISTKEEQEAEVEKATKAAIRLKSGLKYFWLF